jgi:hypothetical protein
MKGAWCIGGALGVHVRGVWRNVCGRLMQLMNIYHSINLNLQQDNFKSLQFMAKAWQPSSPIMKQVQNWSIAGGKCTWTHENLRESVHSVSQFDSGSMDLKLDGSASMIQSHAQVMEVLIMVVEFINEDSWYVFSHVNFIFNCVGSDKKANDSCIYENWDEYKLFQARGHNLNSQLGL